MIHILKYSYFNPRSPRGERLIAFDSNPPQLPFQPSLPARGATASVVHHAYPADISTLAPREGSDTAHHLPHHASTNFNPRSPRGERRHVTFWEGQLWRISTLAPREGSDSPVKISGTASQAFQPSLPARGATWQSLPQRRPQTYFNPRSPRGERQSATGQAVERPRISTLAPREGSDIFSSFLGRVFSEFQPSLPARGATGWRNMSPHSWTNFNPRSPRGERHGFIPSAGGANGFQPSLPARGATQRPLCSFDPGRISTLAPREGSDNYLNQMPRLITISTLAPREGSDALQIQTFSGPLNFNPRSPRGERH